MIRLSLSLLMIGMMMKLASCSSFTRVKKMAKSCTVDQFQLLEKEVSDSEIACALKCDLNAQCDSMMFDKASSLCSLYSLPDVLLKCVRGEEVDIWIDEEKASKLDAAIAVKDCKEIKQLVPSSNDGVYLIQPVDNDTTSQISVYCDMTTDNQQWILLQKRFDGSEDFNRSWDDYKNGFGSLEGEFWLGNEKTYLLTNSASMKVRFDLWDKNDNSAYAEYSSFSVSGESDKYRLSISGYSGTAGDAVIESGDPDWNLNNMQFTTIDQDNDGWYDHLCAAEDESNAFWYNQCGVARINKRFASSSMEYFWGTWSQSSDIVRSEMKVLRI